MIQQATGLNSTALEAIAGLERRVLAADGGRLKLEWGTLRNRPRDEVRDLLWWEDGQLLGFLGIYGSGRKVFEITGMVDPGARRRGIARALFDAALPIVMARGVSRVLMVVPRASEAGRAFARRLDMSYEHSEHAMRLGGRPAETGGPELALRQAFVDDIPKLSDLYRDGFGDDGYVDPARLESERSRTLMIERGGIVVGTIAIVRDGGRGAIYAFVVDAAQRGRGIGRQALRQVCQELFDAGADHVDLEVEVENDRALGLYTSVGFSLVATDDYYELILHEAAGQAA